MSEFFGKLKELFDKIPTKTKFLNDLGFNHSYIGFRYFLQGRIQEPSPKFMDKLSEELGYQYVRVPIKIDGSHREIIEGLQSEYQRDLEDYLKIYYKDKGEGKVYVKDRDGGGSVSEVIAAFEVQKDLLDPDKQVDVSDLF